MTGKETNLSRWRLVIPLLMLLFALGLTGSIAFAGLPASHTSNLGSPQVQGKPGQPAQPQQPKSARPLIKGPANTAQVQLPQP